MLLLFVWYDTSLSFDEFCCFWVMKKKWCVCLLLLILGEGQTLVVAGKAGVVLLAVSTLAGRSFCFLSVLVKLTCQCHQRHVPIVRIHEHSTNHGQKKDRPFSVGTWNRCLLLYALWKISCLMFSHRTRYIMWRYSIIACHLSCAEPTSSIGSLFLYCVGFLSNVNSQALIYDFVAKNYLSENSLSSVWKPWLFTSLK